ncbi:hypothetical protein ASPFODRAFT_52292 [Aspergillus luchuensis CBS 106.47]|uniref:Uncharacterized protein n=1 Tax=Aspergillus luchuensis (strain CBS 106.47) TaxID=1137211 RepID=A0A1M3T3B3_ASPLC|nr:hypothetical protein ASPFODRAFT_52292 [Aspergillus luchuensis CBS 106.47]
MDDRLSRAGLEWGEHHDYKIDQQSTSCLSTIVIFSTVYVCPYAIRSMFCTYTFDIHGGCSLPTTITTTT